VSGAAGVLRLPSELTIYAAAELRGAWLAWADALPAEGSAAAVDGSAVDLVDACGVQLLVALGAALARRETTLVVERPSTALVSACTSLGLPQIVEGAVA
jgi:anti-anti-sigma regulatory factor